MSETPQRDHELDTVDENVHHVWNNALEPALTIGSGQTVQFECLDGNAGEITPETTAADVPHVNTDPVHALTGPVAVDGIEPGDVLEVELHEVAHDDWGWTAFGFDADSFGLLDDEFDDPGLHIWELDDDTAEFVDGIEIPLDPFPGTIGVAPGDDGPHDTYPPRDVGGNIDVQYLTEGATVYLPVETAGGRFSIGDGHAAQGDGEVCQTALETPLSVTATLTRRPDLDIDQPQFETTHPYSPHGQPEPMYATTGIDSDLMTASRKAVRQMLDHLEKQHELARTDAYILCSVVVDLKINQVVAAPHWTVSAHLPQSIFPE